MSFSAPAPALGDFLTAAALMERWHIGRTTLWEWRKRGIPGSGLVVPAAVKLGRQLLFRRDAVERVEADLVAIATPPARRRRRRSAA